MIGHDPHELAAYFTAVLHGYTPQSAQAELERVFDRTVCQLTLTEEVEIRYRTETSTDPETGETTTEEVPYEYYILNVKLTNKPISAVCVGASHPGADGDVPGYTADHGQQAAAVWRRFPGYGQLRGFDRRGVHKRYPPRQSGQLVDWPSVRWEMWAAILTGAGTALTAVWNGAPASCPGAITRPEKVNRALQAVSPRAYRGSSRMDNGAHADMTIIAPGDAIFFDWDLDGTADHVGIVIGTDGSRVYTVEGNSGDACKIKSYDLNYQCIKGYGLMNW